MSENREISKDMKKSAADQDLAWEEVSVEPKGCLPLP